MSTMENFYTSLSSAFNPHDPYLEVLAAINKIELHQMETLTSDLGWQDWWTPTPAPAAD